MIGCPTVISDHLIANLGFNRLFLARHSKASGPALPVALKRAADRAFHRIRHQNARALVACGPQGLMLAGAAEEPPLLRCGLEAGLR